MGARPSSPRSTGARAEQAVVAHLAAAGLEILAVNLRVGRFELDVVARDGPVIAVVEVRTRGPGAWVRALDSVDARKRARVRRAGEQLWRERFARDARVERMRFDVAAVELLPDGGARIEVVRAAF
jgi:putative endonuclease